VDLSAFDAVWALDFEFHAPAGNRPEPLCLVAHEIGGEARRLALWADELEISPFGPNDLLVAFYASAEWGCFLVLGWELLGHVVDLYVEHKLAVNGRSGVGPKSLLGALRYYGLSAMEDGEKDVNRALAIRGGPFTVAERLQLIEYCGKDVKSTAALFLKMHPHIDTCRALIRGRYTKAVARMEHRGIPLDVGTLTAMRSNWGAIRAALIADVDRAYGVFEGESFRAKRWLAWCAHSEIPWPYLVSGRPALDSDTFRSVSRVYPVVTPMKELRSALSELRLESLSVGSDGRGRTLLSPFGSRTGRNQPSNTKFIFGPSSWMRSLIKPPPGWAIAYVDWSQQEFGIAAKLSGDRNMLAAYQAADPYLAFAHLAGAVPENATKATHPAERAVYKVVALGVLFGMSGHGLARRTDTDDAEGRSLLKKHKTVFRTFWRWRAAALAHADLHRSISATFGWAQHVEDGYRPTSISNFPMQANGAEMMRLACIHATESGVRVCAPVHDALLIEAPAGEIDAEVERVKASMLWASKTVLDGFELTAEAESVVCYPGRYVDKRGVNFWRMVTRFLEEVAA
jgi:DNA polymerase I